MSYFKDGSLFLPHYYKNPHLKAVGWLGSNHPYPKGEVSDSLLNILWKYCQIFVSETKGLHTCDFCGYHSRIVVTHNWEKLLVGSAEIRIFDPCGDIFAAPNFIWHYITVHKYKPPDYFLSALATAAKPLSEIYISGLNALGDEWSDTSPVFTLKSLLTRVLSPDHANAAMAALEEYADQRVFDDVSDLVFKTANGPLRDCFVRCLGNMLNPAAKEVLIRLQHDPAVRELALQSLRRLETI